jgi:hypothetical protein
VRSTPSSKPRETCQGRLRGVQRLVHYCAPGVPRIGKAIGDANAVVGCVRPAFQDIFSRNHSTPRCLHHLSHALTLHFAGLSLSPLKHHTAG